MSAKDPIDELFRDNQHGLDEQPRGLVWDRIEEKLNEKSTQKRKLNWWKYVAAACMVVGLSFAAYVFLYDVNRDLENIPELQTVQKSNEVSQEKASEILDKLEEQNQAIATTKRKETPPEIYEDNFSTEKARPSEIYDPAPSHAPVSALPEMKRIESSAEKEEISGEGSIVFRGNTPEKKEKNYITQKVIDRKRMGNMDESAVLYEPAALSYQISIPVKNYLIQYDLISHTDSLIVFENKNIAYPSEIIFQKINDSFQVLYKGKDSKKKTRESKTIQEYVNENKLNILSALGF